VAQWRWVLPQEMVRRISSRGEGMWKGVLLLMVVVFVNGFIGDLEREEGLDL
jgi:hypothetical protein